MNASWTIRGVVGVLVSLLVGLVIGMNLSQPVFGVIQQPNTQGQKYSVVHTEGTNIIVTDNKTNTIYYYTIDPGSEPGSDLKLRATLDLTQVGEQVLKPKLFKKK